MILEDKRKEITKKGDLFTFFFFISKNDINEKIKDFFLYQKITTSVHSCSIESNQIKRKINTNVYIINQSIIMIDLM